MKKWIVALCWLPLLGAQTPPPSNWYGAGASFNSSARPEGGGVAALAHNINQKAGVWEFNIYFAGPQRVNGKETIVSSTAAGFAVSAKSLGPIQIFAFGTGGLATSGALTGNSFPWGGFGDYKVGKSLWHIDGGYMLVSSSVTKTQKVFMVLVGRTF